MCGWFGAGLVFVDDWFSVYLFLFRLGLVFFMGWFRLSRAGLGLSIFGVGFGPIDSLILRFASRPYNLFLNSGKAEKQRSKKRETQKRREAENQRSGKAKKKRIRRNAKQ